MIYGKDAFDGLRILEYLMSDEIGVFNEQIDEQLEKRAAVEQELAASGRLGCSRCDTIRCRYRCRCTRTAFWADYGAEEVPLDYVDPYIKQVVLLRSQWQFRKGRLSDAECGELLESEVGPIFERLKVQCDE